MRTNLEPVGIATLLLTHLTEEFELLKTFGLCARKPEHVNECDDDAFDREVGSAWKYRLP